MNNQSAPENSTEIINALLKKYSLLELLEKNGLSDNISSTKKIEYISKCEANYDQWENFDNLTKEFLIAGEISLDKINIQDIDFSFVSLEFCKAFENEMLCKIFKPYVSDLINREYGKNIDDWLDAEKPKYHDLNSGPLGDSIESVLNHGKINLTIGQMLTYITESSLYKYNNENGRYFRPLMKDLKNYLQNNFNYNELLKTKSTFDNFRINFRNHAAHTEFISLGIAIKTKNQIPDRIEDLFSLIKKK